MTDSVLDRIGFRTDDLTSRRQEEFEPLEDLRSFGWLRGIRDRALMLELRLRNGNILCFGYPWLERAEFDPSEGITLQFGGREIRLIGRNLDSEIRPGIRLFAGIIRHRVPWLKESEHHEFAQESKQLAVIDEIRL